MQAAFIEMGLKLPEKNGDEPKVTEIGAEIWWLNKDPRGAVWINGSEKQTDEAQVGVPPAVDDILTVIRPLLKAGKNGATAEVSQLAEQMEKPMDDLVAALVSIGLKVPEKSREKPHTLERSGESIWLSINAKAVLMLHAKASEVSAENADAEVNAEATNAEANTEEAPDNA